MELKKGHFMRLSREIMIHAEGVMMLEGRGGSIGIIGGFV